MTTKKETQEEYKDIPWYEWIYKISSLWNVKNSKWLILKPQKNSAWYFRVILSKEWIQTRKFIHRLVLETFYKPSELIVNHKDWNKLNNNIDNLEYSNKSHNFWHAYSLWKINPIKWWAHFYSKKVQLSKDWVLFNFDCVSSAAKYFNINPSLISMAARWVRKSTGWFTCKYI